MKEICHYCVHIETMKGEYGPVEDIHLYLKPSYYYILNVQA